jgi:methylated-DNA-protein-cysteine methyltransferase-like protein
MREPFTERVVAILRRVPRGRVATYGQIAVLAGNAYAARQVARLLHSLSEKERLPWHRVIGFRGTISLRGEAGERQRSLLEKEGVQFGLRGRIDLERFLWMAPRYSAGTGKRKPPKAPATSRKTTGTTSSRIS